MFNWLRKKGPKAPLDADLRKWFEEYMLFLQQHFPDPPLRQRKVFTPLTSDWEVNWEDPEEAAHEVIDIIAIAMGIAPKDVLLDFYDNPETEIQTGNMSIFIHADKQAAGLYRGRDFIGRHLISVDKKSLGDRGKFIATLAHEMSHALLTSRIREDLTDEHLTDLNTVFCGFGIFNANSSFEFTTGHNRWGYKSLGYLKQPEWSYALALLAFMRNEKEPAWAKYLNPTVRNDFKKDLAWVYENAEDIFVFGEEDGEELDDVGGRAPGE